MLDYTRVSNDIAGIDGFHCLAEETIKGRQATVEGYVHEGKVRAHGIIDSYSYDNASSFFRFEYPSRLPESVKEEMIRASRKIMSSIGFDHSAFNIEFFYDEEADRLSVLEINPRISQSHSEIFELVDVKSKFPGTDVEVKIHEGMRLSDLIEQDSYSFDIAHVHMGAQSHDELLNNYRECVKTLDFEFAD